jgi:hypothetical protein
METLDRLAHQTPLLIIMALLFAGMAAAREFGAWSHRRLAIRAGGADGETSDEGYILSAVLGLLALLIAFTFGMALDRHETRREMVVAEANALSTAYMRTAVLDQPQRLRELLRGYTRERLTFGTTAGEAQAAAARRAQVLQPQIWAEAQAQLPPIRNTALAPFALQPLNEAFDAAANRQAELEARLPITVLMLLAAYVIVSAGVLGYAVTGAGGRHRAASLVLFALLSMALGVILDLDRPRSGAIHVPQEPMAEALREMA